MDARDVEFLQGVSKFWSQTENETVQRLAFSHLEKYTQLFFNRTESSDLYPKQTNGVQKEDLQNIIKIGGEKCSMAKLLSVFDKHIVTSADMDLAKGTSFALIATSGHFLYAVADYLSSLSHALPLARYVNAGACDIEESVIRWTCDIVGYPDTATGVMVSGTSMGSVIAFATARDFLLQPSSSQLDQRTPVVYLAEHVHGCIQRGLRVVGLGNCQYRYVPSVKNRMAVKTLEAIILEDKRNGYYPFLLIAVMGSTAMGALDPVDEIVAITQKHNIWLHVDASYGGFLLLDDSVKSRFSGICLADSITIDFHKGLSAPFGLAALLCKDQMKLKTAMAIPDNTFLPTTLETEYSPLGLSFEYTRPFRAFPVWFMLKTVGTDAIKAQMVEKVKLTEHAYKTLSRLKNVYVYMKPDLTIIAFRYSPDNNDVTKKWRQLIKETGEMCVTDTVEDGMLYIRLCILSFRTHYDEVNAALGTIKHTLAAVRKLKYQEEFLPQHLTGLVQKTKVIKLSHL